MFTFSIRECNAISPTESKSREWQSDSVYWWLQWRSRGGPGGHGPPQTVGKCFFSAMNFGKMSRSGGNVKKNFPNEGDLSDPDLLLPEKNSGPYCDPEKFLLLPPPPH